MELCVVPWGESFAVCVGALLEEDFWEGCDLFVRSLISFLDECGFCDGPLGCAATSVDNVWRYDYPPGRW